MKNVVKALFMFFIILSLACTQKEKQTDLETVDLNNDKDMVASLVEIAPDFKIPHLTGWTLDEQASAKDDSMIYFNNSNFFGLITTKLFSDANLENYLQEIIPTFEGLLMVSESQYHYNDKKLYDYVLKSEGFIIRKTVVRVDEKHYFDSNFIVVENKYQEVVDIIETYLATLINEN